MAKTTAKKNNTTAFNGIDAQITHGGTVYKDRQPDLKAN